MAETNQTLAAEFAAWCQERGHDPAQLAQPVQRALLKLFQEERLLQAQNEATFTRAPEA